MQGIQKTGVEGHLLGKQSFDVRSNFIESEITGVSLIEAPLSSVIVRDNVLNISTDGTGIRMENVNDVYSSPLLEGIRNNIIKMKGGTQNGGILILNSAGLLVKRNDIDLSLSDNKLFGIKVDGSSNNAFSCNTVTGAGTANNQSKGFMITSSQDNFYTCNTNSANHIGVQFNNVCNGTEFRGNQFLQNGTGLQYSNMGMTQTGDQSWRGNTWDNGQIGVEFQSGGTGIPLSSRYFIQEPFSIASDLWPVNAPNYPDWFFNIPPQTNDLIFECPADLNTCDVDDNFTNPGPCEENDFLMHVANGLTDTSFSGGIKWIAESYLFRRLVEDCTDAVSSNATLSSFFNNHLNTAVGKFQAVAMGREELFELDSSKQQIFDDYSIGLSNFIDSISIVDDSLGLANANEIPGFLSQKEAYLQNLGAMAGPLFALASDIFDQQTTTAAQLKSENNDISVVDVFEVNEKTVNQVYLNTFAVGVSEFSPAQVVQLQSIADQCPVSGGNAVYMARAMLDIKYPQSYDDHTICTNIRERTGGNGLDDETVDQLLVYPNPAGREINLSFAPVKSQATLILSDVFGRQIIDVKLVEGISNFNLQTTDLSSGLYFIKLYYDNDKVLSRTVVISK